MNFDKVDQAMSACHNLLDALMTVSSMGMLSGTLELQAVDLHAWVAFEKKKVTKVVIAETAQTGEEALQILAGLDNLQCRYLPAWVKPNFKPPSPSPEPPAPQPQAPAAPVESEKQSAPRQEKLPEDATTQIFGEQVMEIGSQAGTTTPGAVPVWRRPMKNDEFRQGIYDVDPEVEFNRYEGKLDNVDIPVRKDLHLARRLMETAGPDSKAVAAAVLAKAGFVTDFHDAVPAATDPWGGFSGDPAKLTVASAPPAPPRKNYRHLIAPSIVASLCIAAYAFPALVWKISGSDAGADVQQQQLKRLVETAYEDEASEKRQAQQAFQLPAGGNTATPSANGATSDDAAAGGAGSPAKVSYTEGDEASELRLAASQAGLDTLETLIKSYIAAGNFRRARALAAAGFRSTACTPAQKQKFWQLFVDCRNRA